MAPERVIGVQWLRIDHVEEGTEEVSATLAEKSSGWRRRLNARPHQCTDLLTSG
jgi:hypothetical protein